METVSRKCLTVLRRFLPTLLVFAALPPRFLQAAWQPQPDALRNTGHAVADCLVTAPDQMAYLRRSRSGAFDPRDAVNPCWRCAVLLRWQVQGSPSLVSPFGQEKRHWRFSCVASPLEARLQSP